MRGGDVEPTMEINDPVKNAVESDGSLGAVCRLQAQKGRGMEA